MVWVGELGHNTYMYIHTSAIVDPCMQTARCGRRSEDASCEMRVLAQSGGRGGTNEGMAVGVKPAHGTVRGRAPRARLARHRPRPRTPRTVRCRLRLGIRGCCACCEGLGQGRAVSHANQQHELRSCVLCAYVGCVSKSAKMQCNLSPCARAKTTHPGDGSAWTANAPRMHFAEADHRTCH